ncbi:MAG: transposase [Anaerolineae bacterium]
MLIPIIHNSAALILFMSLMGLPLSKTQRQHVMTVVDGLVMGEGTKTLSALCRMQVSQPDPRTLADAFRKGRWSARSIRDHLRRGLVKQLLVLAGQCNTDRQIIISLDDSIIHKHKDTAKMEGVDWTYDHVASKPGRPVYVKGVTYLMCRIHIGPLSFTVDLRPYLREKTVRRLNRQRPKDKHLPYRSKTSLARTMLRELHTLLPTDYPVVVVFDSWYASATLINWCRRHNWHVICAVKSNRTLDGVQVRDHHQRLKHTRYERVTLTTPSGGDTTYLVRSIAGSLKKVADPVRLLISKQSRQDRRPRYYIATDLSLSTQQILTRFSKRWSCEVANWYLKMRLGIGDFRLRSFEAIEKYLVISWLDLAFLEWRAAAFPALHGASLADVVRLQRREHARQSLRAACHMVHASGDVDAVVNRFAPAA